MMGLETCETRKRPRGSDIVGLDSDDDSSRSRVTATAAGAEDGSRAPYGGMATPGAPPRTLAQTSDSDCEFRRSAKLIKLIQF